MRQVAEYGQVHDLDRLWNQREELPDSVFFQLRSKLKTDDPRIPPQTGHDDDQITKFHEAVQNGSLKLFQRPSIINGRELETRPSSADPAADTNP